MSFGVIGYGRMGSSLVKGALSSGLLKPREVKVMEVDGGRREAARHDGFLPVQGLSELSGASAILLSVKPKDFPQLMAQLRETLDTKGPLFISIAAGIRLESLERGLGHGARVVRAMPNIAASANEAASVYVTNSSVSEKDRNFVKTLLAGIGKAYELGDEGLIDSVTGISGSGPAYFFLLMGAMESAALRAGIPRELARALVAQTCRGSGTLALNSPLSFEELISTVASPGGTTEEALKVLESKGFSSSMADAIVAAIEKSKKMARG